MTQLTLEQKVVIKNTIKKWETSEAIKRAGEELLELHLILLHWQRGKASVEEIKEEMADVHIVLEHLKQKFGEYQEQLNKKVIKGNSPFTK